MVTCRTFVRSVFTNIITHVGDLSPATRDSDRRLTHRNRRFSGSFIPCSDVAVGAVGVLRTSPPTSLLAGTDDR
jgi:hypothetical protein